MKNNIQKKLIYSALTVSSILITSSVNAAGFALREQSTYGQGSSFAGIAAGGDISGSFWNPALISEVETFEVQSGLSIINADTEIESTGSTNVIFQNLEETGDVGGTTPVPYYYLANRINEQWAWGLSLTVPYGSATNADRGTRSQFVSLDAEILSLNLSPTITYQPSKNLTFAAGLQFQYFDVEISRALPVGAEFGVFSATDPVLGLEGDDIALGYTLGVTYQTGKTSLGAGFRSSVDHNLEGSLTIDDFGVNTDINLDLETPWVLTLGWKQQLTDRLTLGITFERTNWSSVGTLPVISNATGSIATVSGQPVAIPLNYVDTNFYSIGGDYQYSKYLTLRAGIGLDESTVTDTTRTTQLPDNDRLWVSFGLTTQLKHNFTFDFGYTYVSLTDEADINIVPGHDAFTGLPFTGVSDPEVHILAFALTKQF